MSFFLFFLSLILVRGGWVWGGEDADCVAFRDKVKIFGKLKINGTLEVHGDLEVWGALTINGYL